MELGGCGPEGQPAVFRIAIERFELRAVQFRFHGSDGFGVADLHAQLGRS